MKRKENDQTLLAIEHVQRASRMGAMKGFDPSDLGLILIAEGLRLTMGFELERTVPLANKCFGYACELSAQLIEDAVEGCDDTDVAKQQFRARASSERAERMQLNNFPDIAIMNRVKEKSDAGLLGPAVPPYRFD